MLVALASIAMSFDYYTTLGVPPEATHEEIVHAYHDRAKLYHPDRNPGFVEEANQRLQELNLAYQVLGDPDRRRSHDDDRSAALRAGAHPQQPAARPVPKSEVTSELLAAFIEGHLRRGHVDYLLMRRFPGEIYALLVGELHADEELRGAALVMEGRIEMLLVITSRRLLLGANDVAAIEPDDLVSIEPAGGFRVGWVTVHGKKGRVAKWALLPNDEAAELVRWWEQF
jgi:DnaJ domain